MVGRRGALAGIAGLASGGARAQGFPERPLRWLVGYPPGGASDVFARLIAGEMGPRLGQPVVVENRPGGGAVLASELAARAAPDGHTLLHVDNGMLVANPALYARLPYDPDRELSGVGFIGRFPLFIVVRPDSAVADFAGLLAAARLRPPNYGTPGIASPHHLAMEMVKRRSGLSAEHVPYRGGPAAMLDLLAGALDCVVIDCATGLPFIRDGRVRALAVLSESPSAQAPGVPTLRSLGLADAIAYGWQGMSVPTGTPPTAIARLHAVLGAAVGSDAVARRMDDLGIERAVMSPPEFQDFVAGEAATWRPLIRALGIRIDG
ncbi:Bug family tripartite tricarboxylate transporter substrate binding protein [Plastoroseomonas arctica]|uniref:Tripartite tricarboxylate transporter substrate binding protein n=1 Tax=Plastoroseomonas arctica TaxID=1509237 RepID=A0AAF1K430_9PROT|nr:tripartite tricarboxylate transporter substrate binding protein [Plastoroseomonas arctica]MBR0656343.1 tripartite tricarboxylate transporter substrate binding protein [Plastoroseomonas arctica]